MKTLSFNCWIEGIVPAILIVANRFFNESVCDAIYSILMTVAILIALFSLSFHPQKEVKKTVRLQVVAIVILAIINVSLSIYFKY